jgi:ribonuclease BN (tRNA processing enzyme)
MKLHVFAGSKGGMRFGESTLVEFNDGNFGLIDSCRGESLSPRQFLLNHPGKKLLFSLVTHPHRDHYLGMNDIISHYKPPFLARYHGLHDSQWEICFTASHEKSDANRDQTENEEAELRALLDNYEWERFSSSQSIFSIPDQDIELKALTPTPAKISKIISQSENLYRTSKSGMVSRAALRKANRDLNYWSIATLLRHKRFKALFLSDVVGNTLKEIIEDPRISNDWLHDIDFVKISHHGGSGANPVMKDGKRLFELLKDNSKNKEGVIAVATHWRNKLPKLSTLKAIRGHCKRLFTVTPLVTDQTKLKSTDGSHLLPGANFQEYDTPKEGCLSFSFDDDCALIGDPSPSHGQQLCEIHE